MTDLHSPDVRAIFDAASQFVNAYVHMEVTDKSVGHPGIRVAAVLSRLAQLERAVDVYVSRETSELERKLDGQDEEPPF